ncbi:MAG: phage holin family protein [Synechococcaceae cyanobacterium]|nr:phage holin family protein [Synechococcaceae cyanobacterium]
MKAAAVARVTALMGSVMDLHVRLALQEADREKRRLIGGGVFLGMGLTLLALSLLAAELVLLLWLHQGLGLDWLRATALLAAIDLVLAGVSLRIGGALLKGPYLPETTAGLLRTTRALTGRL